MPPSRQNGQLFSFEQRNGLEILCYQGKPLARSTHLRESRQALQAHVVPDQHERRLYESLVFAIGSQYIDFEIPVGLLHRLRRHSLRDIRALKNGALDKIVAASRFKQDRCTPAFAYVQEYPGGITQLAIDYLTDPHDVREQLVDDVTWIGPKTASFWYLCLGGRELMTLDIHNLRQLAGLGVPIPQSHYEGKVRGAANLEQQANMTTGGISVPTTPRMREYRAIEQHALALLQQFPVFTTRGRFDPSLATTAFWLAGAKHKRGVLSDLNFIPPYSTPRRTLVTT